MFPTPLFHRDPQNWQQTLFVFTEIQVVKVALKESQKSCSGMHVIPPPPNYLADRTIPGAASVSPALCDDLPEQTEEQDPLSPAQLTNRSQRERQIALPDPAAVLLISFHCSMAIPKSRSRCN